MVKECTGQRRNALGKDDKLDASWAPAIQGTPDWVDGKKGKGWNVRYSNPAAADKTKQTLFIFFSHGGNFIAANFTGE